MNVQELTRDILGSVLKSFKSDIEGIALFGSVARGEKSAKSDVDILIFTRSEGDRIRRDLEAYQALRPIRAKYKVDTTVITLNLKEVKDVTAPLINIAHDGLILFDAEGKVKGFLENVRRAVREAGLTRYKIKDAYGWEPKRPLKPGETIKIELKKCGSS